ncbi:Asp-tRNA(Asn)/Glu-tRNA(Gln) amidotransferase subunit GatB [Candidatus Curtissbacteria bacterium]|nr:Asp-tRNA(Asn)/Glu-tRNA(Gln) amidotransferase subunit GatB [Candidatus Curtissbacteria bacterium]
MNWEAVIGLEVHIELSTKSKMFCGCSTDYFTAKPNTHTCPVCLGLPGAMPKANKLAIKYTQLIGLALNCKTRTGSKFDRKNYFYPDLAKGFQISQYDLPFSENGHMFITTNGRTKKIGITRAHLEEDTGKLIHTKLNGTRLTLVDFNRSGVPLIEIVTEPDISSSLEAKTYARNLQQVVRYLKVSDADMEKGSMRIEPNVSLRKVTKGQESMVKELPPYKVELKNINSFKFAEKAIEYEIKRQRKILESGKMPKQETRGWNETKQETVSQRSKEEAHDYRYFPEPDLPPFAFEEKYFKSISEEIPELPDEKRKRFTKDYSLAENDARTLTEGVELAKFFEEAAGAYKKDPKIVANWITGEVLRRLNEENKTISDSPLLPASLAELLFLIDKGEITKANGKEILANMIKTGDDPRATVIKLKVTGISDIKLEEIVIQTISRNPKAIEDYKKGKEASLMFLIGQVQRITKGQAKPEKVREFVLRKLSEAD